jgi:hypothetical protein
MRCVSEFDVCVEWWMKVVKKRFEVVKERCADVRG